MDGSLLGIAPPLDVIGNVFKYHNRIIHHHTDGYGERAERDNIERIARQQ